MLLVVLAHWVRTSYSCNQKAINLYAMSPANLKSYNILVVRPTRELISLVSGSSYDVQDFSDATQLLFKKSKLKTRNHVTVFDSD